MQPIPTHQQIDSLAEIRFEIHRQVGIITLDRPKALNALSMAMIEQMMQQLKAWATDDSVSWVLIKSSSPKAFCAGGDVRALYEMTHKPEEYQHYFSQEYTLDALIHNYPKPYIAVMDGIVMGGGMGISQGASLRIVTDTTRMAMPETAIGLIPDVGGSYFLSRTHENPAIGRYLASTGAVINGADALAWQLADIWIPHTQVDQLINMLINLSICHKDPTESLQQTALSFSHEFADQANQHIGLFEEIIKEVFAVEHSIDEIRHCLEKLKNQSANSAIQDWAGNTLQSLSYNSPLCINLALDAQTYGRTHSLGECLRFEYDTLMQLIDIGEAREGIRAKIIDKDNQPSWLNHPTTYLNPLNSPLHESSKHPLAHLK